MERRDVREHSLSSDIVKVQLRISEVSAPFRHIQTMNVLYLCIPERSKGVRLSDSAKVFQTTLLYLVLLGSRCGYVVGWVDLCVKYLIS